MKIIIPTFEKIEWMPPTVTLINKLVSMGHEVIYITIYPDNFFDNKRIINIPLCNKKLELQYRIKYIKGISRLLWKWDVFLKKIIAHRLKSVVNNLLDNNSILWVVNEMTVMFAGTSFLRDKEYIFTIYELHKKCFYSRNIVKAAQCAKRVIVPEYCRAHIMQAWYGLKRTPIVLPNKSEIPEDIPLSPESEAIIEKMKAIKKEGKTIILYMGGINRERPLEPILEAIENSSKYCLAVLGNRSTYLNTLEKKYNNILYLGYLQNPQHLNVAKHADIGLLIYVGISSKQSLNALFCAPNKIFEYAGCGLPVIANDIPGLKYSIQLYEFGELADFSSKEDLLDKLNILTGNYHMYQENAHVFFDSVSIDGIIDTAINQITDLSVN